MEQQRTRNFTVQEAGARGGLATFSRYGSKHFKAIGRRGQASLASKITSRERRSWGAMGGRPKKHRYSITGEKEQF